MFRVLVRQGFAFVLAMLLVGALAAPALAVLAGSNGFILLTSGRTGTDADDSQARLHLFNTTNFTVQPPFTPPAGQYRHGTWSPDRTRVAFAEGTPGSFATEQFDIYIIDMLTGAITPVTDNLDNATADHPAWSPDGESIAYEEEVGTNDTGQRDIWVEDVATGGRLNITATAGVAEHKPAWDPFSREIYYNKGDPAVANGLDIAMRLADGSGSETLVLANAGVSEFQASVSPDGHHLCWTQGSGFNVTAEVMTAPLVSPANNATNLSDDATEGDYNCTWSPRGDEILYVKGTFTTGALMIADFPDNEFQLTLTDDAMNFDGNPDWAPDGRPTCPDKVNVTVVTGNSISIPLECTDTGPAYEQTEVRETFGEVGPSNGTLDQEFAGDPIVYTPDAGFIGLDSFTYRALDAVGFSEDQSIVTVNVTAPPAPPGPTGPGPTGPGPGPTGPTGPVIPTTCGGRPPTITGTQGNDTIRGTNRRDVILALGGNDTINSRGGADLICAGDGNDRVSGAASADRILGEAGNDRLSGGNGADALLGGPGIDVLLGGKGRDRLSGGPADDQLSGGPQADQLLGQGGADILRGGPGRDTQRQ